MSTYAFSDLHGNLPLFKAIQGSLQANDICYCLGDCADRGPDGWEIIKEVIRDPRMRFLKGNHEDFLATAMEQYYSEGRIDSDFMLWMQNGGDPTFDAMVADPTAEQWIPKIRRLPTYAKYVNMNGITIHLSHAGFDPKEAFVENIALYHDILLWNRDHIGSKRWSGGENEMIVHGHTPTVYLCNELGLEMQQGSIWYLDNHKVDIDCGTIITQQVVLLDLDTFDEDIFQL